MKLKQMVKKYKKLGLILGLKKMFGYEAIFTWAYRKKTEGKELYSRKESQIPFTIWSHSEKYWYADPLIYEYQNCEAVFMECFDRRKGKGSIGVKILTDTDNKGSQPRIVIEEEFHMSFPMIFEWNETLYMIPETEMNNSIVLYECISFPYGWKKVGEFLKGKKIVDSIVINKEADRVSLLASEYKQGDDFYTKFCRYDLVKRDGHIFSEWKGVGGDSYTLESRMAGPLINDNLIPVQRSTTGIYGYSIKFREWAEKIPGKCIKEVCPKDIVSDSKKGLIGIHTYSSSSNYELIDIQYLVFNKNKWKKSG